MKSFHLEFSEKTKTKSILRLFADFLHVVTLACLAIVGLSMLSPWTIGIIIFTLPIFLFGVFPLSTAINLLLKRQELERNETEVVDKPGTTQQLDVVVGIGDNLDQKKIHETKSHKGLVLVGLAMYILLVWGLTIVWIMRVAASYKPGTDFQKNYIFFVPFLVSIFVISVVNFILNAIKKFDDKDAATIET